MAKKKQLSEEDKAKIIALGKAAEAEVEVAPKTDPSNAPLQETASVRSTGAFRAAFAAVIAGSYIALAKVDTNIHTKQVIRAPAEEVWQLLYKMDEWKDWNDVFDVAVGDGDGKEEVAVGKAIGITCNWVDGTSDFSRERITVIEEGVRICWDYEGMPEMLLTTDRCVTVTQVSTTNVKVENYEIFGGPLGAFVTLLKGRTVDAGFQAFNRALKMKAEGKKQI
eukprot:gene10911-3113_t